MSGLSAQEEKFACPCPRDGYYDVFISFRGIDTRSGFTDTLYRSLLESKIYTFIDADLAGDVIETLYEIIAKSRMAVVVYSERFASSHWCLTELEIIMQRWKEKKMLMIPIFYKIDAHELKHPTEKTIKYFDEHIIKYGETIVGKWKDAVIKIGNVSGFPYKDIYTRSERDFIITQVITKIKKKLRERGESGQESSTSKPYNSGYASTENHDVFISFLGKDTHYDLVSHLNEALVSYKKEIKIFMVDRDLLKDDSIFEVIQRSKMAVIVFSPNYASSKWCLRELVKILQCSNTTGQEFLPIFYEMTQSDLKDQSVKGMIAYHLEKHARKEKSETIQSWRDAITDLGYTVGWRYSTTHGKTEELAHFIQKLVEEISAMLNRVEDDEKKKESTRNEQEVHVSLAKEENAQTLALQTYGEKEFVLTLDHSNFSETTSKHDFIVVVFYATWCEHSKKLAPEYEKAASILSSNHPRVILAKVAANADANKELAREHDIKGFPTLKIFRNGGEDVHEYKGPLDAAEGIVEYLKKQRGPASAEIKSAEDASGVIGDNSLVIVGVFPKFSGEEYNNFIALAEKLRSDYEFAHTRDAKLLPHGDSSVSGPLVRLFKPFDELFVDSKDFNVEALEKFFEESSLPLLTLLNTDPSLHRYTKMFFNSQSAKAMLFMNFTNEAAESMKAKYREVAEKFKGHDIIFLLGDLEASGGAFKYFGLKEEQVPVIVAVSTDEQKYLKANIQVDDIAPWVKDYKDGKVAPFTKTEPIPKVNNKPVKVVVADSIDDVVFKSGKNVLIEFYAPWCAHCKQLAPILDEVALSFESDPGIVIAKFNASANDITCVAFEVKGYPTLYFRSSTGTILQYDGYRTKEYIIDFIKMNRVPYVMKNNR